MTFSHNRNHKHMIILPSRKTFWMASLVSIAGIYLALISRFRLSPEYNLLFEWVGKDFQSMVEHFLTSMAVPALFIASALTLKRLSGSYKHEKSKFKSAAYTLARRWFVRNVKFIKIFEWSIVFAELYIFASLSWEIGQVSEHGFFQWGQFSVDIMGGATFLVAVLLISYRREALLRQGSKPGVVKVEL